MRTKANPIDRQIEQAYYRLAQNRQINVLKITALFRDARTMIERGQPIDDAVTAAILTYCEPMKGA